MDLAGAARVHWARLRRVRVGDRDAQHAHRWGRPDGSQPGAASSRRSCAFRSSPASASSPSSWVYSPTPGQAWLRHPSSPGPGSRQPSSSSLDSFADDNAWTPSGLNPVTLASNNQGCSTRSCRPRASSGSPHSLSRSSADEPIGPASPSPRGRVPAGTLQLLPVLQLQHAIPVLPSVPGAACAGGGGADSTRRATLGLRLAGRWPCCSSGLGVYAAGRTGLSGVAGCCDRAARQAFAIAQPAQADAGLRGRRGVCRDSDVLTPQGFCPARSAISCLLTHPCQRARPCSSPVPTTAGQGSPTTPSRPARW